MSKEIENFKKLIVFLKLSGIDYAILGRRASLAEIVDGDIDIVVPTNSFTQIAKILKDFSVKNSLQLIQCFQHESTAKYFALSDKEDHSIICPDFCSDFVRDGHLLMSNDILIRDRRLVKVENTEFYCLNPEIEFIYYLIKKTDKEQLTPEAFNHLHMQYKSSDLDNLNHNLKNYFNKECNDLIINIFKKNSLSLLNDNLSILKKNLHQKRKLSYSYLFKDILLKVNRVRHSTGLSIAILGPDGSGKSTVITGLSSGLKRGFRKIQYYHLFPQQPLKESKENTNPQGQKPHSFMKSQLKLAFLMSKYSIGYIKVKLQLIKSTLVIFDRYYDDILVDRRRFRYKGFNFILKLGNYLIPEPRIYLYLDAPSEVIFSRKAELSISEIDRQRHKFKRLVQKKKRGFIINANQDEGQVIFDAETKILDYLELRQANRI